MGRSDRNEERAVETRAAWPLLLILYACAAPLAGKVPPQGYGVQHASCDGPGIDPWITELRDRFLTGDALAAFAVETYGSPIRCQGSVSSEFEGSSFGSVTLGFGGGETLRIENTTVASLDADDFIFG